MGDDAAQVIDGGIELMQRGRIVLGDNQVDLSTQALIASSKPTRLSAGVSPRSASCTSLRARSRPASAGRVNAALARMVDAALGERLDLDLQRFNSPPRQRFGDELRDLGEVRANADHGSFEIARRPQRLDPRRNLPKLVFQPCEVDRPPYGTPMMAASPRSAVDRSLSDGVANGSFATMF